MIAPLGNGTNGERDKKGKFAKGNKGGPGNPYMRRAYRWRCAMIKAVKPEDIERCVHELLEQMRAGKPWAIRELLDRTLGKPKDMVPIVDDGEVDDSLPTREELEQAIAERSRAITAPNVN